MKLTTGVNFYQHFTHAFFIQRCFSLATFWLHNFWQKDIGKKVHKKCWWNWPQIDIGNSPKIVEISAKTGDEEHAFEIKAMLEESKGSLKVNAVLPIIGVEEKDLQVKYNCIKTYLQIFIDLIWNALLWRNILCLRKWKIIKAKKILWSHDYNTKDNESRIM